MKTDKKGKRESSLSGCTIRGHTSAKEQGMLLYICRRAVGELWSLLLCSIRSGLSVPHVAAAPENQVSIWLMHREERSFSRLVRTEINWI